MTKNSLSNEEKWYAFQNLGRIFARDRDHPIKDVKLAKRYLHQACEQTPDLHRLDQNEKQDFFLCSLTRKRPS